MDGDVISQPLGKDLEGVCQFRVCFVSLCRLVRFSRRLSVGSIGRTVGRSSRSVLPVRSFCGFFDFFAMSGSSRSVLCQSFSCVRRLETEKMLKNRNTNFLSFSVRSVHIPFDSIDIGSEGRGGPLWSSCCHQIHLQITDF